MFNVCYHCGQYRPDKEIDLHGPYAICPVCHHKHPFRYLPLMVVCGPSGAGKTVVLSHLLGRTEGVVLLEADILWRPEFNKREDNYHDFFETWLRLCKNIAQSGHPVALFNAGAIPQNIEPCIERRYFSQIHYLALVCDETTLTTRLQARPDWRQSSGPAFIQAQIEFNRWFHQQAGETKAGIELIDTSQATVAQTAAAVAAWINQWVPGFNFSSSAIS